MHKFMCLDKYQYCKYYLLESNCSSSTTISIAKLLSLCYHFTETHVDPAFLSSFPIRLVIHGHQPDIKTEDEGTGKLIHLPESMEGLLILAGENSVI